MPENKLLSPFQRAMLAARLAVKVVRANEAKGDPIFPRGPGPGFWSDVWGRPLSFRFAGSDIDYVSDTGDLTQSSLVMAVIQWIGTALTEAPPTVTIVEKSGKTTVVPDHPMVQLLNAPNPFYTGAALMQVLGLSYMVDGNNYWLKERELDFLQVKNLWYLPHFLTTPIWDPEDKKIFIKAYRYRVDAAKVDYLPEDIVHIRRGIDPRNTRKGLGAFDSVLREIYGDNMAANFSAAIFKNWGVVPFVISPAKPRADDTLGGGGGFGPDPEEAERKALRIKESFIRATTGDNRGQPIVQTIPLEITKLSFNPQELDIKELRKIPEARVAGVTGVPAAVLQYLVGLENGTSYASYKEAREQGYESVIIPILRVIEKTITSHLLPDFPDPRGREQQFKFDLSSVRVLQDDQDKLYERNKQGVLGGFIKVSDARSAVGLPTDIFDEVYLRQNTLTPVPASEEAAIAIAERQVAIDAALPEPEVPEPLPLPPGGNDDAEELGTIAGRLLVEFRKELRRINGNGHHREPLLLEQKKTVEYDGMTLWREPTEAEKRIDLKAIRDAFTDGEKTLVAELLELRKKLIDDAATGIIQLAPADFHTLILTAPETATADLRDKLLEIYNRGRELVLKELEAQGATDLGDIGEPDDADVLYLDDLAGVTVSRVTNDVQSRATGIAASLAVLGLTGATLSDRLQSDLSEGSTAYVGTAAAEADHGALGAGRSAEGDDRSDIVDNVYYSAILDENTCQPCEDADGETGSSEDDITPAPNPNCEGWARCRCILVYVFAEAAA